MNVASLVCTYIYETFVAVKTALEDAQAAADKILDLIYGIVKLAIWTGRRVLDPVIGVIRASITSLMKDLGVLWIRDFSDSQMCQNLYKCSFFRDYLLNPDSIFSRAIYSMFNISQDDRYARVQTVLHEITQDFQRFKEQICSGISLDFTLDAITGLFQSFLAQVNKWLRWLRRKVDAIYKFLRYYLDTLKRLGVFDLLDELKAMFDCVIDPNSDFCKGADSANSFYRACMNKMKLYCSRANDWIIKPDYEAMCTSYMNGKINELSDISRKLENGLRLFVNPSNVHPTSDCLDLYGHITGFGKFIVTGKASNIPVYKYCKTTITKLIEAWNGTSASQTKKYNTFNELMSDMHFERDGAYIGTTKLNIEASGEEMSMTIDESADLSSMNKPIIIGDDIYSASYALYGFKTGTDKSVINYFNQYNVGYTDLINLDDVARAY